MMKSSQISSRNNIGILIVSVILFIAFFFWLGLPFPREYQSVDLVVLYYAILSFLFGYLTRRYITLSAVPAFMLVILVPLISYGLILARDVLFGDGLRFEKPALGITVILIQLVFVLLGAFVSQLRIKRLGAK